MIQVLIVSNLVTKPRLCSFSTLVSCRNIFISPMCFQKASVKCGQNCTESLKSELKVSSTVRCWNCRKGNILTAPRTEQRSLRIVKFGLIILCEQLKRDNVANACAYQTDVSCEHRMNNKIRNVMWSVLLSKSQTQRSYFRYEASRAVLVFGIAGRNEIVTHRSFDSSVKDMSIFHCSTLFGSFLHEVKKTRHAQNKPLQVYLFSGSRHVIQLFNGFTFSPLPLRN